MTLKELLKIDRLFDIYADDNDLSMCRCISKHWQNVFRQMTKEERDEYMQIKQCEHVDENIY